MTLAKLKSLDRSWRVLFLGMLLMALAGQVQDWLGIPTTITYAAAVLCLLTSIVLFTRKEQRDQARQKRARLTAQTKFEAKVLTLCRAMTAFFQGAGITTEPVDELAEALQAANQLRNVLSTDEIRSIVERLNQQIYPEMGLLVSIVLASNKTQITLRLGYRDVLLRNELPFP